MDTPFRGFDAYYVYWLAADLDYLTELLQLIKDKEACGQARENFENFRSAFDLTGWLWTELIERISRN
ncbi:hypothetical protein [Methylorubrum extorquens]|uniref:hypothetical protein n=1 Tax=Methylorubrum extorquens TaxID=408 RepID=UPI0022373F67|nr:hypothetical protein [Methylorubrum extorquens]UYW30158.1 hypothetical protein OKB92_14060 [Methylorubrum extorquens]